MDEQLEDRFLSNDETAEFLGVSNRTTEKWRLEGRGPRYRRFGRKVLYRHSDVLAWVEQQPVGGGSVAEATA